MTADDPNRSDLRATAPSATATVTVRDADAMVALGRRIGRRLRAGDAVCLTGPLGAGKTTLTRGIAAALGVQGAVASPTFVIARRHRGAGLDLLHCDAYRVADDDELADAVADAEDAVTVVEWGERVMPALADSWLEVEITRATGTSEAAAGEARTVRLAGQGPDWEDRDVATWADP